MIKEIEVDGVKHGITLGDDMVGEGLVKSNSGILRLKVGTESSSDTFVPICLGSCEGRDGNGNYFGIALGNGLKCNKYNAIEVDPNGTGSGTSSGLKIGTSLIYRDGALEVRFSSNSALSIEQNGVSIRIGTEFDVEEYENKLHIRLGTDITEKTRRGFGLCIDRNDGLALNLAPGTNPLSVNDFGELYIDIQILKELLK